MPRQYTRPALTVTALFTCLALGLPGCGEGDSSSDAGSTPTPETAAAAPAGVSTMALSELARWRIDGFDDATAANFDAIEGVKVVKADAQAKTVLFKWSPAHTSEAAVKEALSMNGYAAAPVEPAEGQVSFAIEAPKLHCGACVKGVQGVVEKIDGVELDRISLAEHRVAIRLTPGTTSPEAVIEAINQAGFVAMPAAIPSAGDVEAAAPAIDQPAAEVATPAAE